MVLVYAYTPVQDLIVDSLPRAASPSPRCQDDSDNDVHNVGRCGSLVEMQLNLPRLKLPQDGFDSPVNGRMVSTIASHEFFDDRPQR